ncbi:MAG: flagellar biosynthesis protein FlhB [Actinomycetota bacterium]
MDRGSRTEKATPKRRSEVRKKGQVARSMEVNSALIILAIFIAIKSFGQGIYESLSDLMRFFLSNPSSIEINDKVISDLMLNLSLFFLKTILPITAIALLVGITASIAQIGFLFTPKPLVPDLKKIDPISGISRLFSARALVELLKSIIKIVVVGYIAYLVIKDRYPEMILTMDMDIWHMLATFGSITYEIGIKTGIALLIIAAFDYAFQRYSFEKSIRMTKQEVKEELKQSEGDPQIKAKIKRKQMEIATRRMMQAVAEADVVITNPVKLAVAIKYDAETMNAPKVVAKGQRLVAERIREIAKENNVPIVEDKVLAQALYKSVEIGQEIPYNLYKAVAEILAYVYQLNK